jgi:hypothetical protein
MSMSGIDEHLLDDLDECCQSRDGLCQHNSSLTDEIVRRGKDAMQRLRRGYEDWMDIAEAVQVGRAESMRAAHTNEPKGKRYEKAMGKWLLAHSFHVIDKSARNHLLECLKHREAIEKWRATLTESERFRLNHPDTVLRKWKAATEVPDPNAPPRTSALTKLKEINIELQEKLHRAERELSLGGGNLWAADDAPEDIATVMLVKLTPTKAEHVAHAILRLTTSAPAGAGDLDEAEEESEDPIEASLEKKRARKKRAREPKLVEYTTEIAGAIDDVFGDLEGLASDCFEAFESTPENLQQSYRMQVLENSADELENLQAPEVPEALGKVSVKYSLPKRPYCSREARKSDAATILEACTHTLEDIPDGDDRRADAQALIDELRGAIDTIETCEFPGMCG